MHIYNVVTNPQSRTQSYLKSFSFPWKATFPHRPRLPNPSPNSGKNSTGQCRTRGYLSMRKTKNSTFTTYHPSKKTDYPQPPYRPWPSPRSVKPFFSIRAFIKYQWKRGNKNGRKCNLSSSRYCKIPNTKNDDNEEFSQAQQLCSNLHPPPRDGGDAC